MKIRNRRIRKLDVGKVLDLCLYIEELEKIRKLNEKEKRIK